MPLRRDIMRREEPSGERDIGQVAANGRDARVVIGHRSAQNEALLVRRSALGRVLQRQTGIHRR